MARFSLNPLNWFRKKTRPKAPPQATSPAVLKIPAKPRKSGNLFMHLINIQKSLRSMDLAMRQQIDFTWLVQKVTGQISLLKLEAETIGEEELAAVAGQVEAYFETVSEGRLDLDEEGLTVIHDFVDIFKGTIGDAVSKVGALDTERLQQWSSHYQALMARMKPGYDGELGKPEEASSLDEAELFEEPEPPVDEQLAAFDSIDVEYAEPAPLEEAPEVIHGGMPEQALEEEPGPEFEAAPEFDEATAEDDADFAIGVESVDQMEEPEPRADDEIPLYDPADEIHIRDVVISDAEIKSAREYMELGKSRPKLRESEEEGEVPEVEPILRDYFEPATGQEHAPAPKSPVELQEVERLKAKLSELHEKQEMLSTKMTSILGDYKKVVQSEVGRQERPSIEDLEIEDLEDIIFIGREKG